MKNLRFLILAMALMFAMPSYAQSILGGAGVCHVDDDPDNITDLGTVDVRYECNIAWDTVNVALYVYDAHATSGNRWRSVPLDAVSDTDTRLDNPRIDGSNLVWDIIEVHNGNAIIGTETIPFADIAPVQDVTAGTGIQINNPTATTFEVENTGVVTASDGNTVDFTKTGTDLTAEVKINNTGNVTLSSTASGISANYVDGDDNSTNELQTIAVTSDATSRTVTLSDGGGTEKLIEGDGIDLQTSGSETTIVNTEASQGAYKNHADAGVGGVAIGEYFYASVNNTMGAAPGTKVRRMF